MTKEMKDPKLSIIIATYNSAKTLEKCLYSIESQKFKDIEVIVIDGLSSDKTVEIISQYPRLISYWHSKKDRGIYDAWNQGIDKARGEYICFIGSDDYFLNSDSVSKIISLTIEDQYDIITSQGVFLSNERPPHIIGRKWNYKSIARRMTVCHPGLLHHRSIFEKHGKFDENLKIVGDYEFLLRLPKTIKTIHLNEATVCISDGGISRSKLGNSLLEKRAVQAKCERIGPLMAYLNYYDKLWRIPIAKMLKIPY